MKRSNEEIKRYLDHLRQKLMVFESCGLTEADGYQDMKMAIDIIEDLMQNNHDRNWLIKKGFSNDIS